MATVLKVTLLLVLLALLADNVRGQFFTKTDKAVPRIGRRMDPAMFGARNTVVGKDVPISQDFAFAGAKAAVPLYAAAELRRWGPVSASLYEGVPLRVSRLGRSV